MRMMRIGDDVYLNPCLIHAIVRERGEQWSNGSGTRIDYLPTTSGQSLEAFWFDVPTEELVAEWETAMRGEPTPQAHTAELIRALVALAEGRSAPPVEEGAADG